MTTIAILPEKLGGQDVTYRAVAGRKASVGRTAGEALDALTTQLSEDEAGVLVIVQQYRPDRFFTAAQQERLAELMARWNMARDASQSLPPDEQAELEALIEAELRAAAERAEQVVRDLKP